MGKITGMEQVQDVPSKVLLLYKAVEQLIVEGADMNEIRVSTITDRAGIGKGTAYDYFDTKEELLACAVIFYIKKVTGELKRILSEISCFREQIEWLLEEVEKKSDNQHCLMQYVHMMTDNSGFSRLVQEKVQTEEIKEYLPASILEDLMKRAVERGEVRKDLPMKYMVYSLFARLVSYMLCIGEKSPLQMNGAEIRTLICNSIVEELCV